MQANIDPVSFAPPTRYIKLILDYAIAVPAVIALLPLFLVLALVIKLDSPGPVFYRRRVMGQNGRKFNAFQFRTMYANSDALLVGYPRLRNRLMRRYDPRIDPRLTRIGRLLRLSGLYELPQLFNVLRQEMSLVGPRLLSSREVMRHRQWSHLLLAMPPGLTGPRLLNGAAARDGSQIQQDLQYVQEWSIALDLQILLRTPLALMQNDR